MYLLKKAGRSWLSLSKPTAFDKLRPHFPRNIEKIRKNFIRTVENVFKYCHKLRLGAITY
jgi:hypothetical protein